MWNKYFLDANIFLRFLTADDKGKAEACRRLVQRAVDGELGLTTHPLILAEVVWVLESYYRLPRPEIVNKLELIMNTPNLSIADAGAFAQAVSLYSSAGIDLADCFAAALSMQDGCPLVSYDRDYDRLEGISRLEPGNIN